MSFSSETKNELARIVPEKKCCMLAEIAGFMRIAGSVQLAGGGKFKIIMTTSNPAVARHYKTLIKTYFSVDPLVGMGQEKSCGYLLFRENHESSKKPPFIVTKTKPAGTSCFDRQEQLYKVWEARSSAVTS